jgi:uncharacterized protein YdiU (UPF0061 family)
MNNHTLREDCAFFNVPKTNSFATLPADFYTRLPTTALKDPVLVHANPLVGTLLGLTPEHLCSPAFLDVVSGSNALPGGDTLSAVYSGHQFGVWAGQLGDGRAHLLGEITGPQGNWELQLKGAGPTPYSRRGDGRAVLRSSIREYLASQAMQGLGIPTTQALSLVSAKDRVIRETAETAAVVARMAPSFIRFGSFEHWAARNAPDQLTTLANYVITHFYPECLLPDPGIADTSDQRYVRLLRAVVRRTALLMAQWQLVGFCHGVMNTDNMSILGLTLDYGPFGFMDGFDAKHICNHTDAQGRYAWHAQPKVAHWNLYQLANSLHVIAPDADALRTALDTFEPIFLQAMQRQMTQKLGLGVWQEGDETLMDDLWSLMQANHSDFTLTFRQLAHAPGVGAADPERVRRDLGGTTGPTVQPFIDLFLDREAAQAWLERYLQRIGSNRAMDRSTRLDSMLAANPLYVLRNHLAQKAIEDAQAGDFTEVDRLMRGLGSPYAYQVGMDAYAAQPPAWAAKIEVSCSS